VVDMTWFEAIVLGVVQGLTEMLPVSSSAHLRLTSALFFEEDAGASFTAVTQLGTETAVLLYFWKDIVRILVAWWKGLWDKEQRGETDYRLGWYVIIGTLPIVFFGLIFKDAIRDGARNLWLVAFSLIFFGLLLALAELVGKKNRTWSDFRMRDGLILGFAQAGALIPGVSRSGGTITAGLFIGLDRSVAARYSFLLAIPAVFGAGILSLGDVFDPATEGSVPSGAQMLVATIIAFFVGLAAVHWMLKWVAKHSVFIFVWYRCILGVAVIIMLETGYLQAT
jgi:undecaprenyl-diphosphatase